MSFSSEVKKELVQALPDKLCCRTAQAYGMLEFSRAFSGREIMMQAELPAVAELYSRLVSRICQVKPPQEGTVRRRVLLQTRTFPEAADRQTILNHFGHSPQDVSVRLNRANLDCDSCAKALLRGVFLACGTVSDPCRDYHLEFAVPHYNLSRDLLALLGEVGFSAKCVTRGGSYVVYMKESERIEDCLTYFGAPHGALEMMSAKMVKSIRNETNRRLNCENANIDKTVAAAAAQRDALRRIQRTVGIDALPEELRPIARLRLDNPDMSLRELGEALNPPLSRSSVNHRLQKIMAFADALPRKTAKD